LWKWKRRQEKAQGGRRRLRCKGKGAAGTNPKFGMSLIR